MSNQKSTLQDCISKLEAIATEIANEIEGTEDDEPANRLENIRDAIDLAIRDLEDALDYY
jgi:uncharacterized protein YdhG (YjbR/CyaY superfamily)